MKRTLDVAVVVVVDAVLSSGAFALLPRTIQPPEFDPIEFDLSRDVRDKVDGLSGRDVV
jgi:hypothetical protein